MVVELTDGHSPSNNQVQSRDSKAYLEVYDAHILNGNFATEEAASLDNEAHAIDPSVFLPQKNTTLVNREAGKDLHAHSENAMDVLDSHKSKTATSIARIGTMQHVDDFTSLYVNSDTVMMGMFSTEGPQPLYRQFLLIVRISTHGYL